MVFHNSALLMARVAMAALLVMFSLTGCTNEKPATEPAAPPSAPPPPPTPEEAAQESRRELILTGAAVVQELGTTLKAELQTALAAGDPGKAVEACSMKATPLTMGVSAKLGIKVRRTTNRPRNPQNAPDQNDENALAYFAQMATSGQIKPSSYYLLDVSDPVPVTRYYKPIRIEATCLICHGPADSLDPKIRQSLADLYPDDRATGYALGDLRGAFVVEFRDE